MKVLIIGGGLGGLCLANGLHKNGIEVRVFERHPSADSDKQGYFIHLESQGQNALERCLNKGGLDDFLATSTPTGAQWAFRDPQLELVAMRDDVQITGKPLQDVERRAIERWELRGVLIKALGSAASDIVQWGKKFTHYEELEGGKVRAFFDDDTNEDGDVLVGADGSKSKVREQRLPHLDREDLGIIVICGQYPLNDRSQSEIPELMKNSSLNNLVPYGKGWLFVSSWHSRGGQAVGNEDRSSGYTLWAYFVPKDDTPANIHELKPVELRDIALAGVRGWAAPIEHVISQVDLSTVTPVHLRCAPHLDNWTPNVITLIGDSIHNMTPAAGIGANTALHDARILTGLLAAAAKDNTSVVEAIGKYEAKMRPYANAAVALSKQIAEGAASSSKAQRFMFRMVLRLAQASPFVMSSTIGRVALDDFRKVEVGE